MVVKLRDFVDSDSDLRAILEAFRDGYTVEELVEAGRRATSSEYFQKLKTPGPAAFTPAVIRRLLAPPRSGIAGGVEENGGWGGSEGFAT